MQFQTMLSLLHVSGHCRYTLNVPGEGDPAPYDNLSRDHEVTVLLDQLVQEG